MAEWSIAAVLKTVELQGSGGSNPSLSAPGFDKRLEFQPLFCVCGRQKSCGFVGGEINPGASSAQKLRPIRPKSLVRVLRREGFANLLTKNTYYQGDKYVKSCVVTLV